jgi:hypothetical protein
MSSPTRVKVRHTSLDDKTTSEILDTLDTVCATGAQSPDVQGSPVVSGALDVLKSAVAAGHASLAARMSLAQALMAAISALQIDVGAIRVALTSYEAAVGTLPALDAAKITKAGLLARAPKAPAEALGNVTGVHSKPGKHPAQGILGWPKVAGATGYAIQVNTTPQDPAGTWTAMASGSGRRRVVNGPGPASQILARVAAVASDGTQSDWSDPVLVTTA